jgi:hypothetical protein
MLAGERLHRDADRLFTIADLTHEPGREEGQAEQPGYPIGKGSPFCG